VELGLAGEGEGFDRPRFGQTGARQALLAGAVALEAETTPPLLPVLSTYLGHVFITGTHWYLTCTAEMN